MINLGTLGAQRGQAETALQIFRKQRLLHIIFAIDATTQITNHPQADLFQQLRIDVLFGIVFQPLLHFMQALNRHAGHRGTRALDFAAVPHFVVALYAAQQNRQQNHADKQREQNHAGGDKHQFVARRKRFAVAEEQRNRQHTGQRDSTAHAGKEAISSSRSE